MPAHLGRKVPRVRLYKQVVMFLHIRIAGYIRMFAPIILGIVIFSFLIPENSVFAGEKTENQNSNDDFSIPVNLIFYGTVRPLLIFDNDHTDPAMKDLLIESFQIAADKMAAQTGAKFHFSHYYHDQPNADIVNSFYSAFQSKLGNPNMFLLPAIDDHIKKVIQPERGINIAFLLPCTDFGFAFPLTHSINIFISKETKPAVIRHLIYHELSHLFGAIDTSDENTTMGRLAYEKLPENTFPDHDALNREIVKLAFENVKEKNELNFILPIASGKNVTKIISLIEKMIPTNSLYPKQEYSNIYNYCYFNKDYFNLFNLLFYVNPPLNQVSELKRP